MDTILKALHDSAWQLSITTVVALLVGILIPVLIYRGQRHRKELSYQVVSNAPVLSVSSAVRPRVTVLFDGHEVSNVVLLVIKMWNAGNVPILRDDYDTPVEFDFGKARVLDIQLQEAIPSGIQVTFTRQESQAIVNPMLLNPKDSFTFSVLVAEYDGTMNLKGRIVGIPAIKQVSGSESIPEVANSYSRQVMNRQRLLRQGNVVGWFGSLALDLISGYGYKPLRIVMWYLVTVLGFALAYMLLFGSLFNFEQALLFSFTSFHGRGFFPSTTAIDNPLAIIAAAESLMGLLIELIFIATFTQRFFAQQTT